MRWHRFLDPQWRTLCSKKLFILDPKKITNKCALGVLALLSHSCVQSPITIAVAVSCNCTTFGCTWSNKITSSTLLIVLRNKLWILKSFLNWIHRELTLVLHCSKLFYLKNQKNKVVKEILACSKKTTRWSKFSVQKGTLVCNYERFYLAYDYLLASENWYSLLKKLREINYQKGDLFVPTRKTLTPYAPRATRYATVKRPTGLRSPNELNETRTFDHLSMERPTVRSHVHLCGARPVRHWSDVLLPPWVNRLLSRWAFRASPALQEKGRRSASWRRWRKRKTRRRNGRPNTCRSFRSFFFAFFPYRRLSRVRSHLWVTVTEQPDSTGGPSYLSPWRLLLMNWWPHDASAELHWLTFVLFLPARLKPSIGSRPIPVISTFPLLPVKAKTWCHFNSDDRDSKLKINGKHNRIWSSSLWEIF